MRLHWLVWSVWFSHAIGQRRLENKDNADEATRCQDQSGYAGGEYIVGKRAYDSYAANNASDYVVGGWKTNESAAEVLTLEKDCPVKYKLHYGDTVTLIFTRMQQYGTIGFDFAQEYQANSERLPGMRFFFAWEKFLHQHRYVCGEIGVNCWDRQYVPSEPRATGSYSWSADQSVEDMQDIRRDFYHQKSRMEGMIFHYPWRRRRSGITYLHPSYGKHQHYGKDDGKLRIVLSAVEADQMTDMGQDTVFEGELEFHEWGGTGDIKKEQYDAVKELYKTTCAPRRNGTAWNQPWEEPWSRWHFRREYAKRWDDVPYCTWLKDGWKESYWDSHISHQGGTCHMISGVRCDHDGNVIYLSFSYSGMMGDVSAVRHLTAIASFYVSFNQFSGTLPELLSTSTMLIDFDVWHNFFSGGVPCPVGKLVSYMDISYNNFDGTLPPCLNDNPKWRVLYMEHNYIQGSYPKSWETLTSVSTLWLGHNELSGSLPDEICNLKSVWSLSIEANRLEGQIPDRCLSSEIIWDSYAITKAEGWVEMSSLTASHNRFSGPVPRINGHKDYRAMQYATYDFNHNSFTGTIGDQWEGLLNVSRSVTFLFRDNRLSGPLPSQIEQWSQSHYSQRVRYDFADNFFSCEPDGRWPEWVRRKAGDLNYWWAAKVSRPLGTCLPVAHPVSVSPASIAQEQVATLTVTGFDFVKRALQICRFTHQRTGESKDAAAIRIGDDLIRCQTPATLAPGKHEVTVSNFGTDFASKELLASLESLPILQVDSLLDANVAGPLKALDVIAVASGFIACFLCGFIMFLYTREKKGQPFFQNVPDKEPSSNGEPLLPYARLD